MPPLAQLALIEPHVAAGDAATLNRTALAVGRKYTGKVRVRPAHRLRSLPAVAPTASCLRRCATSTRAATACCW